MMLSQILSEVPIRVLFATGYNEATAIVKHLACGMLLTVASMFGGVNTATRLSPKVTRAELEPGVFREAAPVVHSLRSRGLDTCMSSRGLPQ